MILYYRLFPLFISLYAISSMVTASISTQLSIGFTQTDNLEIQSNTGARNNNTNLIRSGISTDLSIQKQDIDFSGGYTLQARANYNRGLDNTGDISSLELSANKLSTLGNQWLTRTGVTLSHYDSQPIPINSYTAIQLQNTLGYLRDDNSGVDINTQLRQEIHAKDPSNTYKTLQKGISTSYYFKHESDAPYWALSTGIEINDADDSQYDYDSYKLGIESRQWKIGSFYGSAGIQWQKNFYGGQDTTGTKRNDKYALVNFNLNKNIKKNLFFQSSISKGNYKSSTSTSDTPFYQLVSLFQWQF